MSDHVLADTHMSNAQHEKMDAVSTGMINAGISRQAVSSREGYSGRGKDAKHEKDHDFKKREKATLINEEDDSTLWAKFLVVKKMLFSCSRTTCIL